VRVAQQHESENIMALLGDPPSVNVENPGKSPAKNTGRRRNVSLARLIKANREAISRLDLKPDSTIEDLMDGLRDEALEDLLN